MISRSRTTYPGPFDQRIIQANSGNPRSSPQIVQIQEKEIGEKDGKTIQLKPSDNIRRKLHIISIWTEHM
jgi:hypothetical protein